MDALESEKCPHCGVPAWHAYSSDNTIAFKRKEVKCEGCAEEARQSKDEKLEPGVRMVIHAVPEDGFDKLPGRMDFYTREHKKMLLAAKKAAEEKALQEAE